MKMTPNRVCKIEVLKCVPGFQDAEASLGFQNCKPRLNRLILLLFSFLSGEDGACCSIESLLLSPWEVLINLDKLAILDRLRETAAAESEAERCPSRNCEVPSMKGGIFVKEPPGGKLKLPVIVELLLVREGTSSTDIRSSGPGSPRSNE